MAIELHDVYPAIFSGTPSNLTLAAIDSVEVTPGIEMIAARPGGTVDNAILATAFVEAGIKLTTRDLAAVLAGCSFSSGKKCTAGEIQFRLRDSGGTYASGSSHVTLNSAGGGLLHIEEFGAEQDGKEGADVSLAFIPLYDGTNLPVVANTSQALSGTPAIAAVHCLGPVYLEGAQLQGVQRVRVKTGIKVIRQRADGELYDRIAVIAERAPTVEIEGLNLSVVGTTGLIGSAVDTGLVCYFLKAVPGGGRYDGGDAVHCSVTVTDGMYTVSSISGQKAGNANTRITCTVANNGIAVATDTALS